MEDGPGVFQLDKKKVILNMHNQVKILFLTLSQVNSTSVNPTNVIEKIDQVFLWWGPNRLIPTRVEKYLRNCNNRGTIVLKNVHVLQRSQTCQQSESGKFDNVLYKKRTYTIFR